MESTQPPTLNAQLLILQAQHRQLDVDIEHLHELPYLDQLQLQRLKRQKLLLKQNILRIKSLLIPDLDA